MTTADTLIDRIFDKRYVIKRKLGSGGMADVYLAEDQELGRRVALKLLDDRHASDEQFVERFRREAQSAAGLNHPNIVSIFDRGPAEGDGLRDRAVRRLADDRGRLDRRDGAVPLAGAGARRARRSAVGPLLARNRPLRDADRDRALHRRHAGRDRDETPLAGAEAA